MFVFRDITVVRVIWCIRFGLPFMFLVSVLLFVCAVSVLFFVLSWPGMVMLSDLLCFLTVICVRILRFTLSAGFVVVVGAVSVGDRAVVCADLHRAFGHAAGSVWLLRRFRPDSGAGAIEQGA